ncbi:transcription antitermination factor NusG [Chitinophaga polysaccharea]|uniref:Transcription antitermination factor NusG n=1 Tax=Chitinophaga polysaccharea TaxID=1293035 RepID=A0A561P9S1_9BACT|nr:transcription termination/antitermination NusG family protein [Chitinophaga polysaccharea]TWF34820.1 transcription antitermination factor NusG [Chitinophaga polysaccharea]
MFNEQPLAWYAVYTRAKCEKKVADLFTRKKVEHYRPVKQLIRSRKIIEEPLFPSYVFVHIPESRNWVVRETDNVVNFVYWLGQPAVIPDHEIALIRHFLRDYDEVSVEQFPLKAGEERASSSGGKIIQLSSTRVKVELSSLGCMLVAKVPSREITVIAGNKTVNGHHY